MDALRKVMKAVLKLYAPDETERKKAKLSVESFLKALKLKNAFVGGSYAKGTWTKNLSDVDVFIRYDFERFKERELSELLKASLKHFKEFEQVHGSRDYFRLKHKGLWFELVPILNISKASMAKNITDISPLHVKWFNSRATKQVREAVILLKSLLKANAIYGAESFREGISGYVCEILGVHYNSFPELVKGIASWKEQEVIDTENRFNTAQEAIYSLNASKLGPLIVIDPVQASRNAAAALSAKNYKSLIKLAKELLRTPQERLFIPNPASEKKLKAEHDFLVWIEMELLEGKQDIVITKAVKVHKYIEKESIDYGFRIMDQGWQQNQGRLESYFVFEGRLEAQAELIGPPMHLKQHASEFKKKHKRVVVKAGRLIGLEKRRFTEPKSYVEYLLKTTYAKSRIKGYCIR